MHKPRKRTRVLSCVISLGVIVFIE